MNKKITYLSIAMITTSMLCGGSVFAETPDPSTATTPITAELTLNQNPTTPIPPKGDEGGADDVTAINGLYGIAYIPGALSAKDELQETGKQKIDLAKNNKVKYNIGVQDKTRKNDQQWSLKAKLVWTNDTNDYMEGTTIIATNGNVMENIDGTLSSLTDQQVTTSVTDLTISQDTEVEVMKANTGKTMNGVYNYQFESPKLVIPNVENVTAGTYSATISWNLENTPTL